MIFAEWLHEKATIRRFFFRHELPRIGHKFLNEMNINYKQVPFLNQYEQQLIKNQYDLR